MDTPLWTAKTRIRTANPSSVRIVNRSIVLDLVRRRGPLSRADIGRLTGIVRSSISDIVDQLVAEDLVIEERGLTQRGRTPMHIQLNEDYTRVLGLSMRPDFCHLAEAGLSGRMQHVVRFPTPKDPEQFVRAFDQAVDELEFGVDARLHAGYKRLGVAVPGQVDAATGRLTWIPTRPEYTGFELKEAIGYRTGLEVFVENDCNAGALSELWIRGEKPDFGSDFVFLNIGDHAVGGGIVIDGEPYRGHNGNFAGEFGHMIIEQYGPKCICGRSGCWERYVCNSSTWHRYRPKESFSVSNFEQMLQAAAAGEREPRSALAETIRYLTSGISNIVYAFNPAHVTIAGRLTTVWNTLRSQVEQDSSLSFLRSLIRPAHFAPEDALLHGAICVALQEIFARPRFG